MIKTKETIHIEDEAGCEITLIGEPDRVLLQGYSPCGNPATISVHPDMLRSIIHYLQRFDDLRP